MLLLFFKVYIICVIINLMFTFVIDNINNKKDMDMNWALYIFCPLFNIFTAISSLCFFVVSIGFLFKKKS